jgi:hypothetical protein
MDLFLLHSLILIWTSIGAARCLTPRVPEQLLAAALLAWGNIVATSLFLSMLHWLGEPVWFFSTSSLLAVVTCLVSMLLAPEGQADFSSPETRPHRWLLGAFILTTGPLAFASLAVAYTYEPNNSDSLIYHLPRAMYYLGQGNLAHFTAADPRQIYLPFNYNLLQLFGLIYGAPLQCLNFFNIAAWVVSGIAAYRLCRLGTFGADASLIACWLVLTATPVLAQAATTTPDLPVGAAMLCALVFALRWKQTRQMRYATLTGLAVGLSAGSDLGALLFLLTAGLLLSAWLYWRWRTNEGDGLRAWIIPASLACAFTLPFVLINLVEKGDAVRQILDYAFPGQKAESAPGNSLGFMQFLRPHPPLLVLNEDSVGFGLAGLLFLLGAAFCLITYRKLSAGATWSVCLGLGWIAASLLLPTGFSSDPRNFVPALALLSPGVAGVIDAGRERRTVARYACYLALLLVALVAGWSGGIYLLRNTSRPLDPLLHAAFVPPGLPSLPLLLEYHLSRQTRINIDTDGANERIFPLMTLRRDQRFTSRSEGDPDAYRILSRSSQSRNSDYQNLSRLSIYTLVPIPTKRTAGVEFLATIGRDASARDYFGIEPHAGRTAPVDSNRFLLITLSAAPRQPEDPAQTHIKLEGLNPEDQARLVVVQENDDGTTVPLAAFTADDETTIATTRPFHRLVFRALDEKSGAEIGVGTIPYLPQMSAAYKPIDSSRPSNGRSIFVTEMVLSRDTKVIAGEGLLPTEGPFPQWDLPYIRWARRPSISLTIPPTPELAVLQLSFSLRLHVRAKAAVEVLFNGEPVQHYRIEDRTTWLDQTLKLIPRKGENIVEFRDVSLKNEPDWLDYLKRYPDVMEHLVTHNIPLEQGAREHYEMHGRAEGRTLQTMEMPALAPDSYYFVFRNIRLEGFRSP